MRKLFEYLGKGPIEGDLGVEIETEGENLSVEVPAQVWKTEDDGSLRGLYPTQRAEYVLKKPLPLPGVEKALNVLIKAQEKSNARFNFSFRTSVHVHLNVLNLTEHQLANLMYLYLLVEPVMMRYCGPVRQGNRFCLRLEDAECVLHSVVDHVTHGFPSSAALNGDRVRYAAMNLAAIGKYGSIEFRGMRGTMDPEVLLPWFHTILNLRTLSLEYKNVLEVHDMLNKDGPEALARKVFGGHFDKFWQEGDEQEIARSFSLSYEIILAARLKIQKEIELEAKREKIKHIQIKQGMPRDEWDLLFEFAQATQDMDLYRKIRDIQPAPKPKAPKPVQAAVWPNPAEIIVAAARRDNVIREAMLRPAQPADLIIQDDLDQP